MEVSDAKKKVLAVWPNAFMSGLEGLGIYNMPLYMAEANNYEQIWLGNDWIDAASLLPAEKEQRQGDVGVNVRPCGCIAVRCYLHGPEGANPPDNECNCDTTECTGNHCESAIEAQPLDPHECEAKTRIFNFCRHCGASINPKVEPQREEEEQLPGDLWWQG
jgi:hypothetical protein